MSETPMNKLRALCEKLKLLSWDDSGLCTDPDVDECADELRAILPDVERLIEALQWVHRRIMWAGGHAEHGGPTFKEIDEWQQKALALFDQPVAPKETK